MIFRAPIRHKVYPVVLRTIYPNSGFCTREDDGKVSDEMLDERLMLGYDSPSVALTMGERSTPVSLFDWHRRMGHRSMKTIAEMAGRRSDWDGTGGCTQGHSKP